MITHISKYATNTNLTLHRLPCSNTIVVSNDNLKPGGKVANHPNSNTLEEFIYIKKLIC